MLHIIYNLDNVALFSQPSYTTTANETM